MTWQPTRVRVPASTSNLGSGFDSVGLALDLWLEASIDRGTGPSRYTGTVNGFDERQDIVARTLFAAGMPDGWCLQVHSEIPVSRGLGSSAAATVAALALRRAGRGMPINKDDIFRDAAAQEGHPDNAGPAVFGGLVLQTDKPIHIPLDAGVGVALAIPDQPLSTAEGRAVLPEDVKREVVTHQARRSAALFYGLQLGDGGLIGFGMEDQLAVPARKHLVTGYDDAVAAGIAAGAYGVTLSGSGSALLGLCKIEDANPVAHAMAQALTNASNPARAASPAVNHTGLTLCK